ncbi:hypothetical protein [Algicola sagamiensis]|uniref:hypothetical protein n=1 Tax=Algicola sagamiensis TaxID=163869 RepID=UPI00036942E1|nr:hypothetical protein [Algicola sagamiensis]
MQLQEVLEKYQGEKLDLQKLSQYEQWALPFFHQENMVANPYLSITLDVNLTTARQVYEQDFQEVPGASFQAYIVWQLMKALHQEWTFSTRKIGNDWYVFKNLPVYFPIAIGGDARFKDALIENVVQMEWPEFVMQYRKTITEPADLTGTMDPLIWSISSFIGNLPDLDFSAFQIHRAKKLSGRPYFYFGKRKWVNEEYTAPLSVNMDHANADPFVLSELLQTFQSYLNGKT